MATVAEIAAHRYQEVGYLFVVEGWPIAWTNRVELAGTGASSWIGDDEGIGEGRTVALGLEMPDTVRLAIGLLDSGMPVDDNLSLTLVDRDDHIIQFAEDEEGDELYERLAPTDDPAPSTLIGPTGSVNLHERWINGEAIGASGERRLFQILPGNPLPGLDHAALNSTAGVAGLRASTVQDEARWMEGRPCALYLIRKDINAGTWPAWDDQHDSGYSLLWWGTVKGVPEAQAGAWKVECEGPSSWLRKPLNVNRPAEWRPLDTYLSFGPNEDLCAIALGFLPSTIDPAEMAAVSAYTPSDLLIGGVTPSNLALQLDQRIGTLAATPGADHTFNTHENAEIVFNDDMVTIRLDNGAASGPNSYPLSAVLQLRMHYKAWLHMGWDPRVQDGNGRLDSAYELTLDASDDTFFPFGGGVLGAGDITPDPTPGYIGVRFTTRPVKWDNSVNPTEADNNGDDRAYLPYIKNNGGSAAAISVLQPDGKQIWDIGITDDATYLEGQLAKPPADVTIASGTCDAAGFFAVRGTRVQQVVKDGVRTNGDEETVYQIARVSWVDNDNSVAVDASSSKGVIWCEEWLPVDQWGSSSTKLNSPWAANDLECVPVAILGYNLGSTVDDKKVGTQADHAHNILARLMMSTGTAEWSGVGDAATLAFGSNANLAVPGRGNDLEIADLGLGIPSDLIDLSTFAPAAGALPGGVDGALNRTRLAFIGPFDSQQVIEDILRPRGWCFSLAGGRYGLFARSTPIDIDDAVLEITQANVAADPDEGPPAEAVDFRPLEPVDLVEVKYGESQIGGDGREATFVVQARDPRAAQRRGNARVSIDGRSLLANGSWRDEFTTLWGVELARWYGEPHMTVRVAIKGDVARDVWPGSVVTYTSPWPATRSGAYGVERRVGRVMEVEIDTLTLARHLTILVEGKDPLGQARFAPIARLLDNVTDTDDRHNTGSQTLYCYADAFGRNSDISDVAAFVEPSWSTTGGALLLDHYQSWDGVTWEREGTITVDSVDTNAHTITYSSLSGTIYERRYTILVPQSYSDQTPSEWPREIFGVICDSDGTHGAAVPGRKWVNP